MQKPMAIDFLTAVGGSFGGILRWPQLDQLWVRVLRTNAAWYLYQVGEEPPTEPLPVVELQRAIQDLDQLLHTEHPYDYCGIVYADDPAAPQLIKVLTRITSGPRAVAAASPYHRAGF